MPTISDLHHFGQHPFAEVEKVGERTELEKRRSGGRWAFAFVDRDGFVAEYGAENAQLSQNDQSKQYEAVARRRSFFYQVILLLISYSIQRIAL